MNTPHPQSHSTLLLGLLMAFTASTQAGTPAIAPMSTTAADESLFTRDHLTGNWGGARTALAERGLNFDLSYTAFYQGMFSGSGQEDFGFGDRYDALIHLDTGKLGLWEGGGLHTHLEYNGAGTPLSLGGAFLPVHTAMGLPLGQPEKLVASSIYYSHRFTEDTSMMIGKINVVDLLASDPFYGGWGNTRFANLAFVAPVSGVLPPTIMGAVLNHRIDPITWTLMIYDPGDQTGNYSPSDLFSDGVNISLAGTWAGEWAGRPSSLNLNAVYSTRDKVDLADYLLPPDLQTNTKDGSWHLSAKVTHLLCESSTTPGKGLGIYAKAAVSDGNPNPFQAFITGGLAGHGMVPGREDDVFGIGYFYYNFSDELQSTLAPVANLDDEQGAELFYNCALTPWFRVTADLQWIDPAAGDNDSMWLGSLRASLTF